MQLTAWVLFIVNGRSIQVKAGRFWSCPHNRSRHGTAPHLTEYSRSGHKHVKNSFPGLYHYILQNKQEVVILIKPHVLVIHLAKIFDNNVQLKVEAKYSEYQNFQSETKKIAIPEV